MDKSLKKKNTALSERIQEPKTKTRLLHYYNILEKAKLKRQKSIRWPLTMRDGKGCIVRGRQAVTEVVEISPSTWWFGEGNGTPLQYSCLENPMDGGAWKAAVHGVTEGRTQLSDFTFTFHFHALEKEMATHSSVLAWRIPGTGKPGGLPSMGSHRVGYDWSDLAAHGDWSKGYMMVKIC